MLLSTHNNRYKKYDLPNSAIPSSKRNTDVLALPNQELSEAKSELPGGDGGRIFIS